MSSFPARSAAATISRASSIEVANGFSVSTCAPCASAASATAWCAAGGVTLTTKSGCCSRSIGSSSGPAGTVDAELRGRLLHPRGVEVDPAHELGVGAQEQLARPERTQRAGPRQHGPHSNHPRGDIGASGTGWRPPAGAAQRTALAITRRMSGWW